MKVAHLVDTPEGPQEVLVQPDGNSAYVSCMSVGKVAVIDLAGWKVSGVIAAGKGVDGLAWSARR